MAKLPESAESHERDDVSLIEADHLNHMGARWLARVTFVADGHRFVAERVVHRDARPDSWSVRVDDEGTTYLGATDLDGETSVKDVVSWLRLWHAQR